MASSWPCFRCLKQQARVHLPVRGHVTLQSRLSVGFDALSMLDSTCLMTGLRSWHVTASEARRVDCLMGDLLGIRGRPGVDASGNCTKLQAQMVEGQGVQLAIMPLDEFCRRGGLYVAAQHTFPSAYQIKAAGWMPLAVAASVLATVEFCKTFSF